MHSKKTKLEHINFSIFIFSASTIVLTLLSLNNMSNIEHSHSHPPHTHRVCVVYRDYSQFNFQDSLLGVSDDHIDAEHQTWVGLFEANALLAVLLL